MAMVIETFMNQRMYDEAVTDMKNDLDRRHVLHDGAESSDSDHATELRGGQHGRKTVLMTGGDEGPAFTAAHQHRLHNKKGKKNKGLNKVDNWLTKQDYDSAFMRETSVSGSAVGNQSVAGSTYTRHHIARLSKGNWTDRIMHYASWVNKSLPMFNPLTGRRRAWEIFIMVLVLYNAVSVPLDVSYGMPSQGNIVMYLDYAIDLMFAIDIFATFRTAYIDDQGRLERDTGKIAKRYLKMWFWIDLVATIPYDLLAKAIVGTSTAEELTLLGFLRTPRLLRLGKLIRLLDRLKSANMLRVVILIAAMAMLAHWLACVWYMLYKFTSFCNYDEWAFFLGGTIPEDAHLSAYISSYYASFLLLVGDNQTSANNLERIFFIVVLILGACFYSAVMGQMAVLVANMSVVSLRHRSKQDQTLDVMRYYGIPEEVKQRVHDYYSYVIQYSHPAPEGLSFLRDLPKALHEDLANFLHRKALNKITIFKGLEPAFLACVAERMHIVSFTPRENIFRAGDLGSEMYTIRKGCVAVVGKHRQLMSVLSTGEYFGDIAMFTQAKRTADCVALSHCDLCVLHSYDLKSVMKDFPSSASTLEANAQDQVRQLQVAGRAGFLMEEEENYFENEEEEEEDEEAFFGEGGDSGGSGPPAANGEGSSSTFASSQAPKEGGEGEGGGGDSGAAVVGQEGRDSTDKGAVMSPAGAREEAGLPTSPSPSPKPLRPDPRDPPRGGGGMETPTHVHPTPDPRMPFTSPSPINPHNVLLGIASSPAPTPVQLATRDANPGPGAGAGPVGEALEIEPAADERGSGPSAPPPPASSRRVMSARRRGHSHALAGFALPMAEGREAPESSRTGTMGAASSETTFHLDSPSLSDQGQLISPTTRSRPILRQGVQGNSPQSSASPGVALRGGAVPGFPAAFAGIAALGAPGGGLKPASLIDEINSAGREAVCGPGGARLVKQSSTASSTGFRSVWQPEEIVEDLMGGGDKGIQWMRATVTARGAKVMVTGAQPEAATSLQRRPSLGGVGQDRAQLADLIQGGQISARGARQTLADMASSGNRSRRNSDRRASKTEKDGPSRQAAVMAVHTVVRNKLGYGPQAPAGLAPSGEAGDMPAVPMLGRNMSRRARSNAQDPDDFLMLSPKSPAAMVQPSGHSLTGGGRMGRKIRRASIFPPPGHAGQGSGDMPAPNMGESLAAALNAAEAENARLRAELREAKGELEKDCKHKADMYTRVHGLAGVVEHLVGVVVKLEGRIGGLENQVSLFEVSHRAAQGGGGGIFGIVSENATSHAANRKDAAPEGGVTRLRSITDPNLRGSLVRGSHKGAIAASPDAGAGAGSAGTTFRDISRGVLSMTRLKKRPVKRSDTEQHADMQQRVAQAAAAAAAAAATAGAGGAAAAAGAGAVAGDP